MRVMLSNGHVELQGGFSINKITTQNATEVSSKREAESNGLL